MSQKQLNALVNAQKYNKIQCFEPYKFQQDFYRLHGANGKLAKCRALMAANQVGKTLSEGVEVSYHATGIYPEGWEGHRIEAKSPLIICAGVNSYTTRDLIQLELLGTSDKDDAALVGTGWIPRHLIQKIDRKPGIPGAAEKIYVKRKGGGVSCITLLGYEDGFAKFMGKRIDYAWLDEESPLDVWAQIVRGTIATDGKIALTYTPEKGMTQLVYRFVHECPPNYALMSATWEDAPHISEERREELLAEMLPHEREMRSEGKPLVGDSLIFPVSDTKITCEPFKIPDDWSEIIGIDFGGDHPFAVVKIAFDPNGKMKKSYVTDIHAERRLTISQEASIIKGMGGDVLPVAWPHDGNKHDKNSGKPMADLYREQGVNMLDKHFSNPPESFKAEGTGGNGIDAGNKRMYWAMTEGRFKVFSTCTEWFKEKGSYHKKAGKVVALNDDLLSATRYGYQSALDSTDGFRFAQCTKRKSDFFRELKVDNRGYI